MVSIFFKTSLSLGVLAALLLGSEKVSAAHDSGNGTLPSLPEVASTPPVRLSVTQMS